MRIVGVVGIVLLVVAGCSSLPHSDTAYSGEQRLGFSRMGVGRPVLVFESGMGDGKSAWEPIFEPLSEYFTVFAYDRPGYGDSPETSAPRDAQTIVRELHDLLRATNTPGPYVLIGHSIGGQYMEYFARNYPDEVAALVLIDTRHVDFTQRCQQETDSGKCELPSLVRMVMPGNMKAEYNATDETRQQMHASPDLRSVPVLALSSDNFDDEEYRQLWHDTHERLAGESNQGHHIVVSGTNHYIHHEEPERVMELIRQFVEQMYQL